MSKVPEADRSAFFAEVDAAKKAVSSLTTSVTLLSDKVLKDEDHAPQRVVDPGAVYHYKSWSTWAKADSGSALVHLLTETLTGCSNKSLLIEIFVDVILPLLLDDAAAALPSTLKALQAYRDKVFLAESGRSLPKERLTALKFHLASSRMPHDLRKALAWSNAKAGATEES